jgi:hypothetical protein
LLFLRGAAVPDDQNENPRNPAKWTPVRRKIARLLRSQNPINRVLARQFDPLSRAVKNK